MAQERRGRITYNGVIPVTAVEPVFSARGLTKTYHMGEVKSVRRIVLLVFLLAVAGLIVYAFLPKPVPVGSFVQMCFMPRRSGRCAW